MKIFAKIFICTISVISISLSVLGYIIISDSFKNSVESEYENAVSEYQLVKFALQSGDVICRAAGHKSNGHFRGP